MRHIIVSITLLFSFTLVAQQSTNIQFDEKQFSSNTKKEPGSSLKRLEPSMEKIRVVRFTG